MNKKVLAYIAGLLDGEGCVLLRKGKPRGEGYNPDYIPYVDISNTYAPVLFWIKEQIGHGCIATAQDKRRNSKLMFKLYFSYKQAYLLLKAVLPFLQIKREQAKLLILFYEYKQGLGATRKGKHRPKQYLDKAEVVREALSVLKHKEYPKNYYADSNSSCIEIGR